MKRELFMLGILMLLMLPACAKAKTDTEQPVISNDTECVAGANDAELSKSSRYGVFLNYDGDLSRFSQFDVIVIDAQYFSKEEIAQYQQDGHVVYSYLNIGSLENFRPYYAEYEDLTLDAYDHWEDERWVDVSSGRWQQFIVGVLAPELLEKGIDGFFVDNCDVYYQYPEEEILQGLSEIMRQLVLTGKAVILNGGDTFLDAYCEQLGTWDEVITGINQESVFTRIDWENETFGASAAEDREYFTDYIERYGDQGAEIFLLEYTDDAALESEITAYCKEHEYISYIATSIEMDADDVHTES